MPLVGLPQSTRPCSRRVLDPGAASSVDRRARDNPAGSARRGSLRGAGRRAAISRPTVRRLAAAPVVRRQRPRSCRRVRSASATRHRAGRAAWPRPSRVAKQADVRATSDRGSSVQTTMALPLAADAGESPAADTRLALSPSRAASADRSTVAGDASRRPARAPNTSPSSSELLASRLAPWTPVHATSPAANSPGQRRPAVEIGDDAAHHVVRRRADRNAIASPDRGRRGGTRPRSAETARARTPGRGDPASGTRRARCAAPRARSRARRDRAAPDRPSDRTRAMNASPAALTRRAPFAAQRLRQQEPRRPGTLQRRRMKLHELEIGDRAPRRGTPSRRRRRSPPADSSSR